MEPTRSAPWRGLRPKLELWGRCSNLALGLTPPLATSPGTLTRSLATHSAARTGTTFLSPATAAGRGPGRWSCWRPSLPTKRSFKRCPRFPWTTFSALLCRRATSHPATRSTRWLLLPLLAPLSTPCAFTWTGCSTAGRRLAWHFCLLPAHWEEAPGLCPPQDRAVPVRVQGLVHPLARLPVLALERRGPGPGHAPLL